MAPSLEMPVLYRFLLLYFEPAFAFFGTLTAIFQPALYLNTMAPHAVYSAQQHQVVLTQLAAVYLLFAFLEVVVLRTTNDLRVWKAIMVGMLLSDVLHIYGSALGLGMEAVLDPRLWRWEDWVNMSFLLGMLPVRLGVVLEFGFPATGREKIA